MEANQVACENPYEARFIREFKARMIQVGVVAATGLLTGGLLGYGLKSIEKEAVTPPKIVNVPTYIDRVVNVPIPFKPFVVQCPNDRVRFWAYPPTTGDLPTATGKVQVQR